MGGNMGALDILDGELRDVTGSGMLAGVVAVAGDADGTIFAAAHGLRSIDGGAAMSLDTVGWIASMTKPIAAALLMMLVDAGRIDLDDPIEEYLPEFKGQMAEKERQGDCVVLEPLIRPITVAQVLSHTSGMSFSLSAGAEDRCDIAERIVLRRGDELFGFAAGGAISLFEFRQQRRRPARGSGRGNAIREISR